MPSLIAVLGFDTGPFNKGVDAAQGKARSAGKGIESAFGGLGRSLAGFASVGAVTAAVHSTVEYGSKINDLSIRLGISTDAVQQWGYALDQNGSSIEAAVPFFQKLAVNREKALGGNEKAIASFAKLGVTLDDLKTKRLEDVGSIVAKAFETGDPQALMASLIAVGGKGAADLIAAFRSEFEKTRKDAPLISPEDIEAIDRMGDAWSRLKAQGMALMGTALPAIADFIMQGIDVARIGLDFAVGAFTGAFDALSKLSVSDLLTPAAAAAKVLSGSIEGAGAAGEKAVDRAGNNQAKRDIASAVAHEAYEKKRAALAAVVGGEEEESDKQKKEAAREADRAAKESERLAAKEQAAAAKEQAADAKREEGWIKEGAKMGSNSVNSLQQQGMFFGNYASAGTTMGPEMAALNVAQRSEQHLARIAALLMKQQGEDEALGQGLYF